MGRNDVNVSKAELALLKTNVRFRCFLRKSG